MMFRFLYNTAKNILTGGKYKEFLNNPIQINYQQAKKSIDKVEELVTSSLARPDKIKQEIRSLVDSGLNGFISQELSKITLRDIFKEWNMHGSYIKKIENFGFKTVLDVHNRFTSFKNFHNEMEIPQKIQKTKHDIINDLKSGYVPNISKEQRDKVYSKIIYLEESKQNIIEIRNLRRDFMNHWEGISDLSYRNFESKLDANLEEEIEFVNDIKLKVESKAESFNYKARMISREEFLKAANIFEREYINSSVANQETDSVYNEYQVILNEDFKCNLRLYQEFMVKYFLHHKRLLLGDEMGLGKTVQALACIYQVCQMNPQYKALIVVPASLLINWEREIESKTSLKYISIRGNKHHLRDKWHNQHGIALTSYNSVGHILSDLQGKNVNRNLDILITDESEYVKNPEAARSQNVKGLAKMANYCVYMTGTPIQNNLNEFIELIGHLNPALSKNIDSQLFSSGHIPKFKFKNMVKDIYLRRNQNDVLHELPEKIETDEWIELSRQELKSHLNDLETEHFMTYRHSITTNTKGKTERLKELVKEYNEAGENILVFTFFKHVIDHFERELDATKQLHGQVKPNERQKIIDSLEENPKVGQTLLCQITAIGRGLNLQNASVVIIVEPQLNPALEDQAIARSMRMGQRRSVKVHRLIANDTIEVKFMERLKMKRGIFSTYAKESQAKEENAEATESEMAKMSTEHIGFLKAKLKSKAS